MNDEYPTLRELLEYLRHVLVVNSGLIATDRIDLCSDKAFVEEHTWEVNERRGIAMIDLWLERNAE